ncbi:MAG: YqaE/Pmp3 family membrane protein [Bacteroidia bacterium]
MAKKIISLLTVAILISSCGNQLSILKRHYNKGFYVEAGKQAHYSDKVKSDLKEKKEKHTEPVTLSFTDEKKEEVKQTLEAINTIAAQKETRKNFQSQLKKHRNLGAEPKPVVIKPQLKNDRFFFSFKESRSASSDTNRIILIILCLFPFINLIAVFLKDGSKITLNFLVCLLLDLLFFLPGIIFALLVVLDMVNLNK